MSRSVLLLLLGCWMCASFCAAFRMDRSERCLCSGKEYRRVPFQKISKWEVYHPSASCRSYEIVVKTKLDKIMCLQPESKSWKKILREQHGPI